MSCYKYLLDEIAQLREILADAQRDIDVLIESLEYGPELLSKEDVIQRLHFIDLPPAKR